MANDKKVTFVMLGKYTFNLAHDASLRVNGTFPSPDALLRMSEECVGDTLKLAGGQKTRR